MVGVFVTVCHYIFSQLPEPESISISTVGIQNVSLLRCHHSHLLGTTDMRYPTRFQRNKSIKTQSAYVPGLLQVT
jgi:hypothetical protein